MNFGWTCRWSRVCSVHSRGIVLALFGPCSFAFFQPWTVANVWSVCHVGSDSRNGHAALPVSETGMADARVHGLIESEMMELGVAKVTLAVFPRDFKTVAIHDKYVTCGHSYKGEDGEENQLAVGKKYISGTTGFNDRARCQPPSALIFRDASTNLHRKIKETGLE